MTAPTGRNRVLVAALLASLALVAVITLTPEGTGSAWADPVQEIRWYLSGLTSPATLAQWVGNLGLLAVPAALAVARWPALGAPATAAAVALTAAAGIEVTQWLLPLGRVVSPVDAALNALGAALVAWWVRTRPGRSGPGERDQPVHRPEQVGGGQGAGVGLPVRVGQP